MIKGAGDKPNKHDILTGSQPEGRAFADSAAHSCRKYTSSEPKAWSNSAMSTALALAKTSSIPAHPSRG